MNDEWTPVVVDDPAPPEPDAVLLASVVSRGRQRLIRRRAIFGASAAAVAVLACTGVAVANTKAHRSGVHVVTPTPTTIPTKQSGDVVPEDSALGDGWLAFAASVNGAPTRDIYLVRRGEAPRQVELAGSKLYDETCPAFAPPTATSGSGAQRLIIGRRATGAVVEPGHETAELAIVEVASDGSVVPERTIPLSALGAVPDARPCAIWSPDGNWAALGGAGAVSVVNTNTGAVRRLSGYHPTDLEWRPGTDELTITGEQVTPQADGTDAPVDIYTVSSGDIRALGAARATGITWSPDGKTLAFTGGKDHAGIWVVNADGTNERQLTTDLGASNHGHGVRWSPDGRYISYQRLMSPGERHEVVLVTATADDPEQPIGTETVIPPPPTAATNGPLHWYPFDVIWSVDGTHLVYFAWSCCGPRSPSSTTGTDGVVAVPIRAAGSPVVITNELFVGTGAHDGSPWVPLQQWSHS